MGVLPLAGYYLRLRIQVTNCLASASLTWVLAGMATVPQTPEPPLSTLAVSLSAAVLSPLYLAATSLYAGPTTFLSTVWQARQFFFLAKSSLAMADVLARTARAPRVAVKTIFFINCLSGLGYSKRTRL